MSVNFFIKIIKLFARNVPKVVLILLVVVLMQPFLMITLANVVIAQDPTRGESLPRTTTSSGTTTTTSSSQQQEVVEPTTDPCSLYDTDWGTSTKDSGRGLYPRGKIQEDRTKKLFPSGQKDPLYITTGFSNVDDAKDPLFAATGSADAVSYTADPTSALIPCLKSGAISGIILRRAPESFTSEETAIRGVKVTNCDYGSALLGAVSLKSLNSLCSSDTKIINTNVGCSMDYLITSNEIQNGIRIATNIADASVTSTTAQGAVGRFKSAINQTFLRILYVPGSTLAKVPDSAKVNPKFTALAGAYQNMVLSLQNQLPPNLKINAEFKFSDNFSKIVIPKGVAYTTLGSDVSLNSLPNSNQFGINRLGIWFNSDVNGNAGNSKIQIDGDIDVSTAELFKQKIAALYVRPDALMYQNLTKASFSCATRPISVKFASGQAISVNLYEWVPSSLNLFSQPSCEQVSANGSAVITLNSAVNSATGGSKTYLVCTPCIVSGLFQKDIFGQPVFGIPTGIGCIPSSLNGLITVLLRIATMTAGGVALFIISLSGIRLALNGGNADEVKKAQKAMSSAILGLLVIIGAVLLTTTLGLQILSLGQFGGNEFEFISTAK